MAVDKVVAIVVTFPLYTCTVLAEPALVGTVKGAQTTNSAGKVAAAAVPKFWLYGKVCGVGVSGAANTFMAVLVVVALKKGGVLVLTAACVAVKVQEPAPTMVTVLPDTVATAVLLLV